MSKEGATAIGVITGQNMLDQTVDRGEVYWVSGGPEALVQHAPLSTKLPAATPIATKQPDSNCITVDGDFVYWMAFAVYQTAFALFGANRFGFDVAETGYLLSAFGFLGVFVQGMLVGPVVAAFGPTRTLFAGLLFAAIGWGGSAMTHSVPVFVALLVPGALGIGFCNATLSTLISTAAGPHEQGRVGAVRGVSRGAV